MAQLAVAAGVLIIGTLAVLASLAIIDVIRAKRASQQGGPTPEEQARLLLVMTLQAVRQERQDEAARARQNLIRTAHTVLSEQEHGRRRGGRR